MIPVGNHSMKSSWKGVEVGVERARDSNRITQHQVGAGGGFGGGATCTTTRQHWYMSPAGDKTDWRNPHALLFGIHGMGNGGKDQAPGQDFYCLTIRSGLAG